MTDYQKEKLVKTIQQKLIPAAIDVQALKMYNSSCTIVMSNKWRITIYNGVIRAEKERTEDFNQLVRLAGIGVNNAFAQVVREPTNLNLKLEEFRDWQFGHNKLIYNESDLMLLSKGLIEYLRTVEVHQREIDRIFEFSDKLALPNTKFVIIEKYINRIH